MFLGSNLAGVRVFWNRTKALFFMGSKGHVRHSFGVFFAWHGLESCWCFGRFGSEAAENLSSHRPESTLLAPFLVQKLAFFGPWSCWCFGLFGSEVDEYFQATTEYISKLREFLPIWAMNFSKARDSSSYHESPHAQLINSTLLQRHLSTRQKQANKL